MTAADSSPPLALIGAGCLFPGSADFAALWARVVNKYDAIRDVPPSHWRAEDYLDADARVPDRVYSARGAFLDPVEVNPQALGVAPNNLEATDSSQLLGLVVAEQALADCGYTIGPAGSGRTIDRSRISVILGVTGTLELVIPLGARLGHPIWRRALKEAGVAADVAEDVVARISGAYVPWQENSFPGLLGNVVAGRIANRLDLGGTNCVVDAACASSLGAVHLAALELATGRADVVLTGGIDTFNDIFMFTCFSKTPALSPSGHARPFDADGDGTTLGEGLGVVVLKRLEDARRDGDRIYAVLRGIGSSSDGRGNAIYAPKKEGQMEALRAAYRTSGVSPDTVELVEAHGTGTKVGDATEVSALSEVYRASGRAGRWCALGSIKSQIGHTKAAAGAAGLLKAAAALYHKVLPPTIKVTRPLEVLEGEDCPFYVNAEKRPWVSSLGHPRRAALSAFGFGGSNFHAVLEEAGPEKAEIDWVAEVELIALSAWSPGELRRKLGEWSPSVGWDELCRRADRSRREFDPTAACRLVLVAEREKSDLRKLFAAEGEGAYAGEGPAAGGLAVLFPGQGAQYVGMLRDLACHFPPAHAAVAAGGAELVDRIYPQSAFTAEARAAQEKALQATATAQPALGAVSLGAWRVLQAFGVCADAFAGHSYGELVALCAAGRLSEEELRRLSRLRGRLMAEAGGGDGAMLAVKASEDAVRRALAEAGIELVLANLNAPAQVVLSGTAAAVERAAVLFASKKIGVVRLAVSAAFHSPLVAAASGPLWAALDGVMMPPGAPVYANTTAAPYPDEAVAARGLLANQLARPVLWARSLEALHAAGARSFLEVGPGARLTGLVEATLGRRAAAHALDASAGRSGFADLGRALAWLAARGHAVDLARWRPRRPEAAASSKPGLTVQLTGANYVKPRPAILARRVSEEEQDTSLTLRASMKPTPHENRSQPMPPSAENASIARALEVTRESLAALARMQEQTAQLHKQFLDGQDQAHRTVHLLVEQQQRLLASSLGLPSAGAGEPGASATGAARSELKRPAPVADAPGSPAPAPPRPLAAAPTPAALATSARVESVLLEVIAEKTGYPADMLGLGMALDADLGIDSIKRVEILSALQERLPEAPAVKPEHLGTLHTLGDIAAFLAGTREGEAPAEPRAIPQTGPPPPKDDDRPGSAGASPSRPLERTAVRAVPLSADRAVIDLPAGAAVWLGDDDPALAAVVEHLLTTRGLHVHRLACADMPRVPTPANLRALILLAPPDQLTDDFLLAALLAVKHAAAALRSGALLTVSRLDGAFGLGGAPLPREPLDGGLAGLAKTAGREWPDCRARALDVAPELPPAIAGHFVAEELFLTGPAEVGRTAAGRTMLTRTAEPVARDELLLIEPGDLVVISGGARGVTAAVAVALAEAFRPRLALLGRSPLPDGEPAGLAGLDENALKQELARRHPNAPPRTIGEQARALLAQREVRATLGRIRAAGAEVEYHSADVRDAGAITEVMTQLQRRFGPVKALIHGAGVLADARLEDKTPEQFTSVYATKVAGLRHLLAAAGDSLQALVLFSSSTARFGRAGQADYAIANEVLNKLAAHEAAARPGCRVVALNWGPWDGGMVSPSLKQLFAREGVETIPLDAGAELVVRELRAGPSGPTEVVVLAAGSAVEPPVPPPPPNAPHLPPPLPTAFERVLDLADHPVLTAHVLDGRPVVPVALLLEWLAHAAMVQSVGLTFHGCDDLRVLHGLTLDGPPPTVRVGAAKAARRDGLFVAPAEVRSVRPDGREVLHARADIILTNTLPPAPPPVEMPEIGPYPYDPADAYGDARLFHGPALHAIATVEGCGPAGIAGAVRAAPPAAEWLRQPLRQGWLADPLALDGVFQLLILWSHEHKGAGNLPAHLKRYRQYRRALPAGGVRVVARVDHASDLHARATVDLLDGAAVVARLEGYECVIDPALGRAFRRRAAAPA